MRNVELHENDVIIVEGLHALNPNIIDMLDESKLFRIYISVSSRVYENDGSVLLSKRDLRFIRRMVRDYKFRSMPVIRTFEIWSSVMRGEDKYLYPYRGLADVDFNTFHAFEPGVMRPFAERLISDELAAKSEYAGIVKKALSLAEPIDQTLVPKDSLIREFITGGIYEEFY
jgi:uridine kinase